MSPQKIRIFIVDDQTIFRESLVAVLGLQKDFQVIGHTGSFTEARSALGRGHPDILLLDVTLPGANGLDLLRHLPELSPETKAIVIAGVDVEDDAIQAMRLGARGYLVKDCSTELFLKCIRKVFAGEVWLNGRMTEALLGALSGKPGNNQAPEKSELSRREMEVIQLVVQAYKNRDIANKLFISEKTVKNHLSAIFNKLGVADRLELTLYVFEKRFFSPSPE
ncbi:MAG: response regulator transcription factor [Acidobacteria bacterium]|nr:response regulator transcription factor [Acidobacteriota bacterium]